MYNKKEIFIFDLDFTLWNAGDTFCSETAPPYKWESGKLKDCSKRWIRLYPETVSVLTELQKRNKTIILASRTLKPEYADQLLSLFDIDKFIRWKEIYPGSKVTHFKNILNKIKRPLNEFVFFDDEERNIKEVSDLGIDCVKINGGISYEKIKIFL